MGFRFRKSIKIAPGVRVNLNKKSTSVTFGGKGFHHTVSSTGRKTTTAGIPGTGISYTTTEGGHGMSGTGRKKLPASDTKTKEQLSGESGTPPTSVDVETISTKNEEKKRGCFSGCLWLVVILLFWPLAVAYYIWKTDKVTWSKKVRVGVIALIWMIVFAWFVNQGKTTGTQTTHVATVETAETAESQTQTPTAVPTATPTANPSPTPEPTEEPMPTPTETPAPTETPVPAETPQPTAAPESLDNSGSGNYTGGAAEQVDNSSAYQPGMVYIASSGNGKKYHSNPNCSKMQGATAVTKEQAEAWGYTPCKRCY
ncbi:MAG: DUF4236 domain-containing protein [Gemmiger sp.]|jgi:hypothetical protein|uniref:DUF4236 domain-containing protein n=1 Tax=Gemmiger sp. TaxID=2049027 RepID=UPI00300F3A57